MPIFFKSGNGFVVFGLGEFEGFALRTDHWLKNLPDIIGDNFLSFHVWVDAVWLVEFFDSADAFEEEGDKGGFGFFGDFGEEGFELGGKFLAHVVGHLHAGDEDFNIGIFGAGFLDDAEEVLSGFPGRNPAESVVSAEGDDEDVGSFGHGPGDAAEAAGGGVAADAGIGDGVGKFGGFDFGLKEGGVGFLGIEPVSGGDAVAENDNPFGRIVCIRGFFSE